MKEAFYDDYQYVLFPKELNKSEIKVLEIEAKERQTEVKEKQKPKIVLPLFDEKERREIIISLNSLIQDANKFLENYKQKLELIVEQDTYISPEQLFKGKVVVWRKTKVKPFIESYFGKDFYNQLKFDNDNLTTNAIRQQIKILKKIVEEL